jgi:hypothetical protein
VIDRLIRLPRRAAVRDGKPRAAVSRIVLGRNDLVHHAQGIQDSFLMLMEASI